MTRPSGDCGHEELCIGAKLVEYADGVLSVHHKLYLGQVRVPVEVRICSGCGHWLALGPANDAGESVQVEIRAVEILDEGPHPTTPRESEGWTRRLLASRADHPPRDNDGHAGWLAHALANHDREQAREEEHRDET